MTPDTIISNKAETLTFSDGTQVIKSSGGYTIKEPSRVQRKSSGPVEKQKQLSVPANPVSALRPLLHSTMMRELAFVGEDGALDDIFNKAYWYPNVSTAEDNYYEACKVLYGNGKKIVEPDMVAKVIVALEPGLGEHEAHGKINERSGENIVDTLAKVLAEYYPDEWKAAHPEYFDKK